MVAIVDTQGEKVVEYLYDAWGRLLTTGGTKAADLGLHNALRYRGYVYDPELGLYYLQSRYYNPAMGRFINADAFTSTGQGILGNNMFAYCGNNPVVRKDSSGDAWVYVIEDIETAEKKDENGKSVFETRIIYSGKNVITFFFLEFIIEEEKSTEATFTYTVNNGAISFDNKQADASNLEKNRVCETLAEEMYDVCTAKSANYLSGRTVAGIAKELLLHYQFYKLNVLSGPAEYANIGGTDSMKPGYDSNGWIFELLK